MSKQGRRAALGITLGIVLAIGLGIALAVMGPGVGSHEMQSRTPIDAQSRTVIEVASLGPQVGERVPAFSLPDQNGQIQTLESILGPRGAMLLFHRSADW
jgi:hypothetical protein